MLGNVVGSRLIRYLNNGSIERISYCSSKKAGKLSGFGSDVGQVSNRKAGILAADVYDFEAGMDIHLTQDKAGRLDYAKVS